MNNYDTRTLIGVINQLRSPISFWLQFFPKQINFTTMDIQFDMVSPHYRLAPFVAPNVQGRVMKRFGHTAKTFRPAYVKPKHPVDPSQGLARMAGEALATGSLTPAQRIDAIVTENLQTQKDMIQRRWEWMAAKAIIDSAVTVAGDDYPTQTVLFGRDAALSTTLLTTARWSQAGTSHPLVDLGASRKKVFDLSSAGITRLVFGTDAWDLFANHADVTPLLSTLNRGSDTEYNRAIPEGTPYEYRGKISGQNGLGVLELYTYSETYEDENGAMQPFMDSYTVVGVGPGVQGVRCFGAIMDLDSMQAVDMFPKSWTEQDPSVRYVMTQSAPLMVPAQPNSSFVIHVNG